MSVFVSAGLISAPGTPCFIKRREERKRKKEKFYIYLDVTHTHYPCTVDVATQWQPIDGAIQSYGFPPKMDPRS